MGLIHRFFFTVGGYGHSTAIDPQDRQQTRHNLRPALPQRQIVLAGTALVTMTLEFDLHVLIGIEIGGMGLQGLPVIGINAATVKIEMYTHDIRATTVISGNQLLAGHRAILDSASCFCTITLFWLDCTVTGTTGDGDNEDQ